MNSLPNNFKWFRLISEQYIGRNYEMRHMFNQSMELLQFCKALLRPEQIKLNKKFDNQQNGVADVNYYISNDINGIDKKILDMFDLSSSESFYIWGGGKCGIPLYNYLLKRKIKVKAIIDNRPKNEFPSDICIISPNDIEPYSKIFIAVLNDISNIEIKEQIKDKKCHFLTYKELAYNIE